MWETLWVEEGWKLKTFVCIKIAVSCYTNKLSKPHITTYIIIFNNKCYRQLILIHNFVNQWCTAIHVHFTVEDQKTLPYTHSSLSQAVHFW